jgi:hypothetical protein
LRPFRALVPRSAGRGRVITLLLAGSNEVQPLAIARSQTDMEATTPEQEAGADGNGAAEKPPFSLELSQDQKDIRDWIHGFAEQTVRPAAAEWDEREETPWPVIQEAAKIGLYSLEGIAQF